MTPFMHSMQALLDGDAAPQAATTESRLVPLPIATDAQMMLFPRDIYREDFFDSADRAAGTNVVRSPLIRR